MAPPPKRSVKSDMAGTLQTIGITVCVFVILYTIVTCIRRIRRRRMESYNMPSPPEPSSLDPTQIASLPTNQYTRRGKEDEPASDCTICLNEVDEGDAVRVLPVCLHLFHKDCIDLWLEKNNTCPVCRTGVIPSTGLPLLPRIEIAYTNTIGHELVMVGVDHYLFLPQTLACYGGDPDRDTEGARGGVGVEVEVEVERGAWGFVGIEVERWVGERVNWRELKTQIQRSDLHGS
ncbi:RING-H2 finger protein ATL39-like protein [Carex littledalei]|uniref:RING-H2 finger protein ATL39-like protein n=1 Tax=Carex littledalei TaxID=544730 RepID=A0A833RVL7_9POAL|nr:RING-H2 finger protein ATL39-like protein [Carex littledalei]